MLFLDLMLNAFASITRLNQVTNDVGPMPGAAAGPAVPVAAAAPAPGGIVAGYPYPAIAGVVPANGFSNRALVSQPAVMHGGIEIWYQLQIANYLQYYQRLETAAGAGAIPFVWQREAPMPGRESVDFFLAKTNGGILYNGYYEIKVQLDNNWNTRSFLRDIYKTIRYVQNCSVTQNGALPRAPLVANREYVCMLYIVNPAGFPAVLAGLPLLANRNPYLAPYPGAAGPFPAYPPVPYPNIQAFPAPAAPPAAAYPAFPNGNNAPVPGVVHLFQAVGGAGYTFQEVGLAAVNAANPLLCVYNGS